MEKTELKEQRMALERLSNALQQDMRLAKERLQAFAWTSYWQTTTLYRAQLLSVHRLLGLSVVAGVVLVPL